MKSRHFVFFCCFRTLSDLESLSEESAKSPTQLITQDFWIWKPFSGEIFSWNLLLRLECVWLFLFLPFPLLLSASLTCLLPQFNLFFLLPPKDIWGYIREKNIRHPSGHPPSSRHYLDPERDCVWEALNWNLLSQAWNRVWPSQVNCSKTRNKYILFCSIHTFFTTITYSSQECKVFYLLSPREWWFSYEEKIIRNLSIFFHLGNTRV